MSHTLDLVLKTIKQYKAKTKKNRDRARQQKLALKNNKPVRSRSFQYEDYSWMEKFK